MTYQSATSPSAAAPRGSVAASEAPRLDDLTLAQLRGYRQQLRDEEDRASYWRRLVHARLDLLRAGRSIAGSIGLEDLVRALGDTGTGASRTALLHVGASDELPDLPDLAEVWVTPTTPEEHEVAMSHLLAAEQQLTAYRSALFARLEESTAALIARYRADPTQALAVLV